MNTVRIVIGRHTLLARWEEGLAPRTCEALIRRLPLTGKLIHVRWSGEACWIPMGDLDLGVPPERPITTPEPGQILFYPKDISETEILIPYGKVRFASVAGPLAGTHVLTVIEGNDLLSQIGRETLWEGARDISFLPG
jgi:hypothetical protein